MASMSALTWSMPATSAYRTPVPRRSLPTPTLNSVARCFPYSSANSCGAGMNKASGALPGARERRARSLSCHAAAQHACACRPGPSQHVASCSRPKSVLGAALGYGCAYAPRSLHQTQRARSRRTAQRARLRGAVARCAARACMAPFLGLVKRRMMESPMPTTTRSASSATIGRNCSAKMFSHTSLARTPGGPASCRGCHHSPSGP